MLTLIDELIACPKKLASDNLSWQPRHDSDQHMSIKSAIEIDGEIRGRFFFICNAKLYSGNEIESTFILSYEGVPIERMTLNPHAPHTNQRLSEIPRSLRSIILLAGEARYYSWKNNKNFGFPPQNRFINLPAAMRIDDTIEKFSDAVNYFFIQTSVQSVLLEDPPFKQLSLL